MAQPSLTDAFGASAEIAAGTLSITLSEISDKLDANSSSEAIFVGLLQKFLTVQDTANDRQVWIVPNSPNLSIVEANAFVQQVFVVNVRVIASIDLDAL